MAGRFRSDTQLAKKQISCLVGVVALSGELHDTG